MAISTLQVNANEDLFLVDGRNLGVISGEAACEQSIRQATKMRLAENIFNVSEGVDYIGSIFSPQPDVDAARKSIVEAILSVQDVISVEQMTITISGGTFAFEADVLTIYGTIPVRQSISQ